MASVQLLYSLHRIAQSNSNGPDEAVVFVRVILCPCRSNTHCQLGGRVIQISNQIWGLAAYF